MNYYDECTRTPSGLTISIKIDSATDGLVDRSGSDRYCIEGRNRSLCRYTMSADSKCEDDHVRLVPNGTISDTWITPAISVRARPGSGGYSRFSKSVPVVSTGNDRNQSINGDVTWTPVGFSVSGSESLSVLVDTV